MKQTSVEWLYNHLFPKQLDGFSHEEWNKIDLAFKQAKEMDEKNLKDSFVAGAGVGEMFNNENRCYVTDAEKYLKETFKS